MFYNVWCYDYLLSCQIHPFSLYILFYFFRFTIYIIILRIEVRLGHIRLLLCGLAGVEVLGTPFYRVDHLGQA
jgi:hypothetical protein